MPAEPPPKADTLMKRCFTIVKKLESKLLDNNISSVNFWDWVRTRYQVESRTETNPQQCAELAAELDASERTPEKFNELANRICDLINTEIVEETAA